MGQHDHVTMDQYFNKMRSNGLLLMPRMLLISVLLLMGGNWPRTCANSEPFMRPLIEGSHIHTQQPARELLGQDTAAMCISDGPTCMLSPAYPLALPPPANLSSRYLSFMAYTAWNCSALAVEQSCSLQHPCVWLKSSQACSISPQTVIELAPAALTCPMSDALSQISCSASGGAQQECSLQSGCSWTEAGCLITPKLSMTVQEQQKWLVSFEQLDQQVWGACSGTELLRRLLGACHHLEQATCEAERSCRWNSTAAGHLGCSLKPATFLRMLAESDAFGSGYANMQDFCSTLPSGTDCEGVGDFTVPAAPENTYAKEFGYLLLPSNPEVVMPGHSGPLSLEGVRTLQYVQLGANSTLGQCLPANSQGQLAYQDCLQLRVRLAAAADQGGSRQLELVPVEEKSELNCPCVFKLAGNLSSSGGVGTLKYAANDAVASAAAADATITSHPVLARTCSAALTQHAAAGQSLVISYQGGNHSVEVQAAPGAHNTLTVQGDYVLLTDNTGCSLQFKVIERGVPDMLQAPGQAPSNSTTTPDFPPLPPPNPGGKPLSAVQRVSYAGLRKGSEEQCLPVNSHGFSPYTSCLHLRLRALPGPTPTAPRTLQATPEQGLSEYRCPCLLLLSGGFTDETETRAEVQWEKVDWAASWNVTEYLQQNPNASTSCSARTQGGNVALDFQPSGEFNVTVPKAGAASSRVILERQEGLVLLQDAFGCVLEFTVSQEDAPKLPNAGEALGPNALAAVSELNFMGLAESQEEDCLPVNALGYCPFQQCFSWVLASSGPEGRQLRLTPKKGTSEFGCPCLLAMEGNLTTAGGEMADLVFQPMEWASTGWDVAAYMAAEVDVTAQCAAALKLQQGQASPLSVAFGSSGNYSVATGQPPVNYTLRRDGIIATLAGGDGCVMLFDVKDSRKPHPTPPPPPPPYLDYDYGYYEPYSTDNETVPPLWPLPAPGPVELSMSSVLRVDFFTGPQECLPVNQGGSSPLQGCYNLAVSLNTTHLLMEPARVTSELGCPCLFRLAGPFKTEGDVATSAKVVYEKMEWGGQWDVAAYVQRTPGLPALCNSVLAPPPPAPTALNVTFQEQPPYYSVDLPLRWEYSVQREMDMVTLRDSSGCRLTFLITAEEFAGSSGGSGASGTQSHAAPSIPEDAPRLVASHTSGHSQKHHAPVAVIVVLAVIAGAAILGGLAFAAHRAYSRQQQPEREGYDPLVSAELADMGGSSAQDRALFLGPYRQF